ncbi:MULTISPECIES: hypothetical protein [unclassified Paenibacillus]|uniref:hypothetical protein n=1 Tax=unclassified Paenibacillus TaxID=185978 RepID=UPI00070FA607|nr:MULTISPECIES: hypothetical protein [unclassified Paenibacillus]KQX46878.1 hypothetical protein ASD40_16495 [Paenibacillus sp. Root444D2]KRE34314.1 hypothetical protein ASG85_13205 [Paenibacillus sp. Soil724D2]
MSGLPRLRKILLESMKGLKNISSLGQAPALTEFIHWFPMNMKMEDYIPLLSNPSVKRVNGIREFNESEGEAENV